MRNHLFIVVIVAAALCSCKGGSTLSSQEQGDTIKMNYAQLLTIVRYDDRTEVEIADPWNKGKVLHKYTLNADGTIPTKDNHTSPELVVGTSVHCGLLEQLGKVETIKGVCDLQYVHLPRIQKMARDGKVVDCGSGLQPTVEKIISLQPDAIFLSPFQNSGGYGRVDDLGITIIEMADYMETSALGRAEWMRFYGMLVGAAEKADSLFAEVEHNYKELCSKVKALAPDTHHPVLMDKMTGSVWYVPGGKSTIGRMLGDAGCDYPWATDNHSGSLALPFETVFQKARNAGIWLFRYNQPHAITYDELLTEKNAYKEFSAFKERRAYGCNTATSTFYEDTPFHPDFLLRDFITIIHPELGLGAPKYFLPL